MQSAWGLHRTWVGLRILATPARWRRWPRLSALAPAARRTGAASLLVFPTRAVEDCRPTWLVETLVATVATRLGLTRSRG